MILLKSNVLKLIISTLFVLVAVNCSPIESELGDYLDDKIEGEGIVGGENVGVTEFPYTAQIINFDEQVCGAAIISPHWLLTAAHCLNSNALDDWLKVIVGTKYRNERGNPYLVKKFIPHENFNYTSKDNDIALIKLDGTIYFNRKQKPIPIGKINPEEGQSIKVAGFGRTGEHRALTWKLKGTVIPVVNVEQCSEEYKKAYPKRKQPITRNMFCAGNEKVNTCFGDSGGPAVIDGQLVGIVSWGFDCGASKLPGVYTKVNNYREWISNHTGLTL